MRKTFFVFIILSVVVACSVYKTRNTSQSSVQFPAGLTSLADTLRYWYSLPADQWPRPHVDSGVLWQELGIIPPSPLKDADEKLKAQIQLGYKLFFDPRLSTSNQIACASCHIPDLAWTDGREKSVGHNQALNKRNSPSILNVWFYKHLFWDGRSSSLEDQAFSPINSEAEMHSDMGEVTMKIRRIKAYQEEFGQVFGNKGINPETLTEALAAYQRSIVSRKADFDNFLAGKKDAMSDAAIRGLHLFRTKARCINCHSGPLFTDDNFHNIGLTYYGRLHEDLGRYKVTQKPEDVGKFRTPSLRDVMRTRPWMHNGLFDNMEGIINMYSAGMPQPKPKPEQVNDPLFPKTDVLIKKLDLSAKEKQDVIAFLESITGIITKVRPPALPEMPVPKD